MSLKSRKDSDVNKNAHIGFSLGGSIALNSLINHWYSSASSGASTVDIAFRVAGPVYSSSQISHGLPGITLEIIACKLLYFFVAGLAASLPDRIEKRDKNGIPLVEGHRAFSHSLLLLAALSIVFFTLDLIIGSWMKASAEYIAGSIFFGLWSAIFWHVMADMCTKQGVKIFWPSEKSFGLFPKFLRPTNNSPFALFILLLFVGMIAFLFAQGTVGF
jgi:membrane-bound metal-dependent hydrolase YbcI (DUF457 family)